MTQRLDYPATQRNRAPILEVLRRVLPTRGQVLEVASGSGQHVVYFARHLPGLTWQPSDVEEPALASIAAWTQHEGLDNVLPPIHLDTTKWPWPIERADAVFCANLVHIAPWEAAKGLIHGAGELLPRTAPLILYGPFKVGARHTAPSNEAFDQNLRTQDPSWGVRDLDDILQLALEAGLDHDETVQMPANNLTLVFRRV